MKNLQASMLLLLSLLAAASTPAHAVRAADLPPPVPEAVRGSSSAAATRAGIVTELDVAGERIEIDGVAFRVVPGRTQVFRAGRPLDLAVWAAQAKGQRIQYTTSPGGVAVPVLGVVHAR